MKEGSDTIVSPRRWDGIAKVAIGGRRMKFCIVFLSEPESCQQAGWGGRFSVGKWGYRVGRIMAAGIS